MANRNIIMRIVCLALLFAADYPAAYAQETLLWGGLHSGPFAVGFKTSWQWDYSRTYNMVYSDGSSFSGDRKSPRPILVNLWYPAQKSGRPEQMRYRDYLNIASETPPLANWSQKLIDYDRDIIANVIMGKAEKELTPAEKSAFDDFLNTRTACLRNATPAKGRFPLVVYRGGDDSSFEENSVLCEYLASQGYVVIGSAYPEGDGASFGVAADESTFRDLDFLIRYAQTLPNVDWSAVGLVGHSSGAQSALMYRSNGSSAVDAIVSLDTTQDHFSLSNELWNKYINVVRGNNRFMTVPLLMATRPGAYFALADTLSQAERYYLTIAGLRHDDFMAQGMLGAQIQADRTKEKEVVRSRYQALCEYILLFFNSYLNHDGQAKGILATRYREASPGDPIFAEYAAKGSTGPAEYRWDSSHPPTPRQVHRYLESGGRVEKILEVMERFRQSEPEHPVYSAIFRGGLVEALFAQGRQEEAITAYRCFSKWDPRFEKGQLLTFVTLASIAVEKHPGWARKLFTWTLILDPDNAEAKAGLDKLDKSSKP